MEIIKNYDPNYSHGVHKVEITLQAWDYRTTLMYKIGGNCKGLGILHIDVDDLLEPLGFFSEEEEEKGCTIILKNDNGDELEVDIFEESELEDMIVGLKIVDFIEEE